MANTPSGKSEFLVPAPANFNWPRCPEADQFIEKVLGEFLARHGFARKLSDRMLTETSTLFSVWVDHVILPAKDYPSGRLSSLGFLEDKKVRRSAGTRVFAHPYADLPRILISTKTKAAGCAIMVDELWRFQLAHRLTLPIEGVPFSGYRFIRMTEGNSDFLVVERRGILDIVPETRPEGEKYLACFEQWMTRPRHLPSAKDAMNEALKRAQMMAQRIGTGPAATVFLEGERIFWQMRNHAAQIQKNRQDSLGLGWANHDHHTFRSSRSQFPMLIKILLVLGFKKRERYYAGKEAGWGAQIMEQPEAGLIIFADVDLSPSDVTVDFSKVVLPDLAKPGTVGLWCALHGESILDAGMHHLEAKFEFEQLKKDLKDRQVETMAPFSNYEFLRQAFTKAEMWRVPEARLNALRSSGKLSEEAYAQIKVNGAVGSHMENLQRRDGFKGFNQKGVSAIIAAVNPEKQALSHSSGPGAA